MLGCRRFDACANKTVTNKLAIWMKEDLGTLKRVRACVVVAQEQMCTYP